MTLERTQAGMANRRTHLMKLAASGMLGKVGGRRGKSPR
jgi:hypothetical protein